MTQRWYLRDAAVLFGGLLAVALTVVMFRWLPGIVPTTIGLALLLVVLITATFARLWIATVVAFVATAAFNYFFFPPVGTFAIADPQHWVAVIAFLVVAVIASNLSAAAQGRARERQKAEFASILLASLSHDLKTPLTAIRVAVENLRDDLPGSERRDQAGAAIVELERLDRLFQDILDMARIDAAAIPVEREWVTPADIVDAAAAQVRHALNGHALRVDSDMDAEVEIDPRVASVALSHVLENAAWYSPADRQVVVEARARSDGLHVTVTDQGPGLAPDELDRLFERFYRGRGARQLVKGTGMGLAITRGLLAAIGGRVWAENVPGAGARFTVVVPGAMRPVSLRT